MLRFAAVSIVLGLSSPSLAQQNDLLERGLRVPSLNESLWAGDIKPVIKAYTAAARSGDGQAAYMLGLLHEAGAKRGEPWADQKEAIKWYNAARVLGYTPPKPSSP